MLVSCSLNSSNTPKVINLCQTKTIHNTGFLYECGVTAARCALLIRLHYSAGDTETETVSSVRSYLAAGGGHKHVSRSCILKQWHMSDAWCTLKV